ncbi:MAG: hypothetical protein H0U18_08360, partial [Pyrinomonadaceae bacterium]|nr:hypothetical protein [Pyrinomonadaceae bacterium]
RLNSNTISHKVTEIPRTHWPLFQLDIKLSNNDFKRTHLRDVGGQHFLERWIIGDTPINENLANAAFSFRRGCLELFTRRRGSGPWLDSRALLCGKLLG